MSRILITIALAGMVAVMSAACSGSGPAAAPTAQPAQAAASPGQANSLPTTGIPSKEYPVLTQGAGTPAPIPATPGAAPAYPVAATGSQLLQDRCTVCHNLDRIQSAHKTPADWAAEVALDRSRGAKLTDAEASVLVAFLAATYK
jgi:hypothetical protein